jgi:hypothetical protein
MKTSYKTFKTFSGACIACNTTEQEFNTKFNNLGLDPDTIAYEKLKIIAKAINEGWQPDWNDRSQEKWFPVFNLSSGFGFSISDCHYSIADVGSRLCFESEKKSNYAATQFIDIYRDFIK